MANLLTMTKRVVYGANRDVLIPGESYDLPKDGLDDSTIKRIEARGAGTVGPKTTTKGDK